MELLTRHAANITMTNEAAIQIGKWLNIIGQKEEEITDEQKNNIKKEFRKLLTRLGYPEDEKCIILEEKKIHFRVICHFAESSNTVTIDHYPNSLRVVNSNGETGYYEVRFNDKSLNEVYLSRKIFRGRFLDIKVGNFGNPYCVTIQSNSNRDRLKITLCPGVSDKIAEGPKKWINISDLEKVLQSVTFPIVLEELYRQIFGTLDESVKKSYSMIINSYHKNELINTLQVTNGELKKYIVAVAEELQMPVLQKDSKRSLEKSKHE